jgi:AraC-like DNA-binding protein
MYETAFKKHQPVGYRFKTSSYERFQAIYVTTGTLCAETSGELHRLGRGQAILLREGSRFALSCPRREYDGVSYEASGALPGDFAGACEVLTAGAEARMLADLMVRELRQPGPAGRSVLLGLGRALAWELVRQGASYGRPTSSREWAEAARALLDATLTSVPSAREALSSLPLSYRQVSRCFAEIFGCSPKQYQLQSRVDHARRLLEQTSLPVTSIAMELGYCSSQHFATQFRQVTGQSPSAYAELARQDAGRDA